MVVWQLLLFLVGIYGIVVSAIDIANKRKEYGYSWYWHVKESTAVIMAVFIIFILLSIISLIAVFVIPLIEPFFNYKIL